ncbi:MAG: hypothetical protein ACOY4O_18890 [Pseudomonadota bacterium]
MTLAGIATLDTSAYANAIMEERKLPMRFTWHDRNDSDPLARVICDAQCKGWIAAVGVVTGDTEKAFDEFASGKNLNGATIVLDSSGGSVLDAIELGRRWRKLGVHTAVGLTFDIQTKQGERSGIMPEAYCESMCAFLLLSGSRRTVPDGAHVRVHQIWLGDRVENAKASSYSAQDLMIVQRDVGRLTKFAFEMGGTGELLDIALSVPPWEPLRELSYGELRRTNVVTGDVLVAEGVSHATPVTTADLPAKLHLGHAVTDSSETETTATIPPRRTAEVVPTGGRASDSQK